MKRASPSVASGRKAVFLSDPIALDSFSSALLGLLPRLRRFACGLSRDRVEADDLCQTTLERALRNRDKWQDGTRLDSWIYKMMRNIWIDEVRARNRRGQTFMEEEMGVAIGADGGQEAGATLGDIDRALATLPEEQREAVILVMVEGYSYKEAAEIVGCPVGTLNSRLVRGRDALLAKLGEAA
ncbi:RNA polymerase sigma factor [Novosphingobium cyanobacteriorum]|uniref:RNA polymerase sigma factor n=1 Tax=Novosphingobium cyanobacteriorum TaxID=3024215 RepID=A0ABT6CDU9_9SPHN|nr:RNA polymerase sigma factor [Novosphingobium cyanobacteriorum]MDF8331981.1 RNA polymerase sigma factor [Novosphingobium cyanobacteriorum]